MKVQWEDDFEKIYKKQGQQRHGIRLLALWKIQAGMTEKAVCALIGKTQKTVRLWRKSYEQKGLDGLLSINKGRGRKQKGLTAQQLSETVERLHAERKGGRVRCQDIVDAVSETYGITYSVPGMYHVLNRHRFSWITGRSKHPKSNEDAQEAFKEKSPAIHSRGDT